MTALLEMRGLTVASTSGAEVVRNVSFSVARGEVVALIGESGSGKTTTCLAALGYFRPGLRHKAGQVLVEGVDILKLSREERREMRGRKIAYVAQSAAASFNPALTVEDQVVEVAKVHRGLSVAETKQRALTLYREMLLPSPDSIGRRFPHQVSGGQLQRLMAAMALCAGPEILVLDEPTTALDVTTQIGVLTTLKSIIRKSATAALYVTHDLAVVAQIADRIIVLRNGEMQEEAATARIIEAPQAPYTSSLIAACRRWTPGAVAEPVTKPAAAPRPLMRLEGVTARYAPKAPAAIDAVSFNIRPSSVVGVIGESGSGKSTLARVIAGLMPAEAGQMQFDGAALAPTVAARSKAQLRRIQLVFQSADVSLNPTHRIGDIIGRPIKHFYGLPKTERDTIVREALEAVKLPPAYAERRPSDLSGGEKQRVNLARALAAKPDLILCDEVTSALDTLVAASIIELLRELQAKRNLSLLFISHDVSTLASFAEELLVMYRGRIVERGPTDRVLNRPEHPYTKVLVSSVPQLRTGWLESAVADRQRVLEGAGEVRLTD